MLTRHALTLTAAIAMSIGIASPATAGGKVVCDKHGNCTVVATNPGSPGGGGGGSGSPGGGGGDGGEDAPTAEEIYQQWCLTQPVGVCGVTAVPTAGPGTPAAPAATPAQAAQQAISQLQLRRPRIGSAPCTTTPDCTGTVGVPVWVWTEPWQPLSATATAGPFTVTATARISSVRWSLGDGTEFTCTTPGTEYKIAFGFSAPDCGKPYGYQRAGEYQIGATYQWDISWSGATSGSTTMQTRATTPTFPVSEYQAIVTHNG